MHQLGVVHVHYKSWRFSAGLCAVENFQMPPALRRRGMLILGFPQDLIYLRGGKPGHAFRLNLQGSGDDLGNALAGQG